MRPVAVFLLVAMTACGSDLDPLGMWWTFGNHEPVAMYRRVGNRTTGGIEGGALWLREGEGQALRDGQEVSALWPVLEVGPSSKSVKRVCREVHELTHSRNVLLPVETVVERVNRLLNGWGAFYSVGYPSMVFRKVNHYVLKRMAQFLNRKSQRYCRLKFADTYYGEMTHYGLYRLAWADVRRTRT